MTTPTTINLDLSQEFAAFLRLLNRRKLTVAVVSTLIFAVVALGTFLQKPVYRATATITIDMETPSLLAIYTSRDDATMAQSNYLTYADYYRTQLEILKSRRVAELTFQNLDLAGKPRYRGKQDPVKELMRQISVEPVKQTRLVQLRVIDRSKKRAAEIANEVARVFVYENLSRTARSERLNLLKNEYLSLQSKEAELSKRYKPKFPARQRVQNQMAQVQLAIEKENAAREQGSIVDPVTGKAVAPVNVPVSAEQGGSLRPNNIWIQTPAYPPHKAHKPNKPLNLLLGLLFGLLGGMVVAAIEEFFDATIKTSNDITDLYPHPFLGHVPQMPEDPAKPLDPRERYQHMRIEGNSEIAEAYRAIRTNFLCAPVELEKSGILITSPGSEEGKTTTACNMAMALAQTGVTVLLVDADLRKPNVYKALDLPQTPGLSEFLTDRIQFNEALKPTQVAGLTVVTSGAIPKNPSELLGSAKMREFYKMALEKYNFVLIDTAPMIPVTDATILAAMTQRVIVVAQSAKTPREAFKRMIGICEGLKAKIAGIILNRVPLADLTGYGYGYQVYRYGKEHEAPKGEKNLSTFLEKQLMKARRWHAENSKKKQA